MAFKSLYDTYLGLLTTFFQTRLFWSALGRPCQVRVNKRVWYRKHLIPKHPFIFFTWYRFCPDFAQILPHVQMGLKIAGQEHNTYINGN